MSKKRGNLIKEARTAKGITQSSLADQVAGLTASEYGKIERGEKEPTQDIIKKIAKTLGVTQKSLLDAATGGGKTDTGKKTSSAGRRPRPQKRRRPPKSLLRRQDSGERPEAHWATEKKLVELYRKADAKDGKAAIFSSRETAMR